jgi:hypothetical protein
MASVASSLASSSSSVIEGRRRTCGGVRARVGRRWRTCRWLSVVSKHVRLVGVVRSVESLVGRGSPSPVAPAPLLSSSRESTIIGLVAIAIAEAAAGMRAGADKGPWSGNLCSPKASGAGLGGRGFSYPSTCIDMDIDESFSFSLPLPISNDNNPCSWSRESLRGLAPLRTVVVVVAAVVALLVWVAVIVSAGLAIGAGPPLVLSSASSAAHLARTRAATSSAALSFRRRGVIRLLVLWRDSADDVALLRLLPGSTVA